MKHTYKNPKTNGFGGIDCLIILDDEWVPTTQDPVFDYTLSNDIGTDDWIEIAPYIEPTKTLEQLQKEAVSAMAATVMLECRSGTGKLYFSDLNSAARHANELIQPDAEIRARAIQLLSWDIAIDAYALEVLFNIEQGGEVPTLEAFIAGLPTL